MPPTHTRVVRFEVAYDGAPFHGWQIQSSVPTVQGHIQEVLSKVFQRPIKVNGASRTDAGVHAMGQVVSLPYDDLHLSPYVLQRAMNSILPQSISILRAELLDSLDAKGRPFHARHSARGKIYRYSLWPQRISSPFDHAHTLRLRRPPSLDDWRRTEEAAQILLGTHDFAAFRAADCEANSTVRTLHRLTFHIPKHPGERAYIEVEGSAFLKNMVRILVGTFVDVASQRLPLSTLQTMLDTLDRKRGGQTAPPQGLRLETIFYPEFPWSTPRWSIAQDSLEPTQPPKDH